MYIGGTKPHNSQITMQVVGVIIVDNAPNNAKTLWKRKGAYLLRLLGNAGLFVCPGYFERRLLEDLLLGGDHHGHLHQRLFVLHDEQQTVTKTKVSIYFVS